MKKLVLMSRNWIKVAASKTVDAFDSFASSLFSGDPRSITFVPPARSPQDDMYMQMLGAQQGSLDRLIGARRGYTGPPGSLTEMYNALARPIYPLRSGPVKPKPILEEGKVNVNLRLTRIDKEHILVEVECIRRIVHNAKELRELTAKLIEEHAEEFLFSEVAKRDIALGSQASGPMAKEPPGEIKEVSKK